MHPTDSADQQTCDWFGVMPSCSEYSVARPLRYRGAENDIEKVP